MNDKEPRTPTPAEQAVLDAMTDKTAFDGAPVAAYAGLPCDDPAYVGPPNGAAYWPERYLPPVAPVRGPSTLRLERNAAAKNGLRLVREGLGRLLVAAKLTCELWTTRKK